MAANRKLIVCGDFHIPYHSEKAVLSLLARIRSMKPESVVIVGDFLDCKSLSKFVKAPNTPSLQDELTIGKRILKNIKSAMAPGSRLFVLGGNHEKRLATTVNADAPGLYGLEALKFESLLDLKPGEWFDYGKIVRPNNRVICWHGNKVRQFAGYSAKGELMATGPAADVLCTGHTHRLGVHYRTDLCGTRAAVECGCLCDPVAADYIAGPFDWQVGWVELIIRPGHPVQITTRPVSA